MPGAVLAVLFLALQTVVMLYYSKISRTKGTLEYIPHRADRQPPNPAGRKEEESHYVYIPASYRSGSANSLEPQYRGKPRR